MTVDIKIYLNGYVSLVVPECAIYCWVYVCERQQGCSGTKLPRLYIYRSIMSLRKITYQMCHGHPFSQRYKTSKKQGAEGWKQQKEGFRKILNRWGRKYGGSS